MLSLKKRQAVENVDQSVLKAKVKASLLQIQMFRKRYTH